MGPWWCGFCSVWTNHDTAHHEAPIAVGDLVRLTNADSNPDLRRLLGRQGRVEALRGAQLIVAFASRSGTDSVRVDPGQITKL